MIKKPVFVFGTLLDAEILELVCQQPVDKLERRSATLLGFEPRYVIDQHFPVLVLAPNSITYGNVIVFDDVLLGRLSAYELDDFELCDISVKLEDGTDYRCQYFANIGYEKISDRRWSIEEFQQLHKDAYIKELKGQATLH